METVLQDLRYAMRVLRRSPAFALVAVVALALGIGANTAIFSVVNTVILKPLPYPEPGQLVQLWMRFTGIGIPNDQNWVSVPEFIDLQRNTSFSHIAAISQQSYNVTMGGSPERIESAVVTPSSSACRRRWGARFGPKRGNRAATGWSFWATATGGASLQPTPACPAARSL